MISEINFCQYRIILYGACAICFFPFFFCICDFIFIVYTLEGSGTLILWALNVLGTALSWNWQTFGLLRGLISFYTHAKYRKLICRTPADIHFTPFEYFQCWKPCYFTSQLFLLLLLVTRKSFLYLKKIIFTLSPTVPTTPQKTLFFFL